MRVVKRFVLVVLLVGSIAGSGFGQASVSEHLTMGNPSNAKADPSQPDNYLMVKKQYVLAYDKETATPKWVSWHLSEEWLGDLDRSNDFRADETLPNGWFRVTKT